MGESDRYGRQRRSNLHVKENLKKKTEEVGQSKYTITVKNFTLHLSVTGEVSIQ